MVRKLLHCEVQLLDVSYQENRPYAEAEFDTIRLEINLFKNRVDLKCRCNLVDTTDLKHRKNFVNTPQSFSMFHPDCTWIREKHVKHKVDATFYCIQNPYLKSAEQLEITIYLYICIGMCSKIYTKSPHIPSLLYCVIL